MNLVLLSNLNKFAVISGFLYRTKNYLKGIFIYCAMTRSSLTKEIKEQCRWGTASDRTVRYIK